LACVKVVRLRQGEDQHRQQQQWRDPADVEDVGPIQLARLAGDEQAQRHAAGRLACEHQAHAGGAAVGAGGLRGDRDQVGEGRADAQARQEADGHELGQVTGVGGEDREYAQHRERADHHPLAADPVAEATAGGGSEHQADDRRGQDVGDLSGVEVEGLGHRRRGQAHRDDVGPFQQGGQEADEDGGRAAPAPRDLGCGVHDVPRHASYVPKPNTRAPGRSPCAFQ
jgi:hypothetical protein